MVIKLSSNQMKLCLEIETEFNDIDRYIQMLNEEKEVTDFIENGKYPYRLTSNQKYLYMPILDDISFPEFVAVDNSDYIDKVNIMIHTINEIEIELKSNTNRTNIVIPECQHKDNICPICMDDIGDRNYMVPLCGHRVCMNCVVKNFTTNLNSGSLCCLCRGCILPIL